MKFFSRLLLLSAVLLLAAPMVHAQGTTESGASGFRLQLPKCVSDGRCSLDDIVMTGVSFANLLMGLSGAAFFGAFIYGGGMYVMSFGQAKRVETGTTAMKGAAIGMIIVVCAWTIVNYVVSSLLSSL